MTNFSRKWYSCDVRDPVPNIRFWVYPLAGRCMSAVKLTLRPGDEVVFESWGKHSEGWHRVSDVYSYDGINVMRVWYEDGADCDGRVSRCGREILVAVSGDWNPISRVDYPIWKRASSRQRDYTAEAMGY